MAQIEGLDAFKRKMAALPAATRQELEPGLQDNAARLVNLAQALAPVDEGHLRSSVRAEAVPGSLAVRVRAGGPATTVPVREGVSAPAFDYSARIEFTENPFFYPAYRSLKRVFAARMRRAIKAALAKTGAGS